MIETVDSTSLLEKASKGRFWLLSFIKWRVLNGFSINGFLRLIIWIWLNESFLRWLIPLTRCRFIGLAWCWLIPLIRIIIRVLRIIYILILSVLSPQLRITPRTLLTLNSCRLPCLYIYVWIDNILRWIISISKGRVLISGWIIVIIRCRSTVWSIS